MKTKTQITDITHGDIVNLFSTATYGSDWLRVQFYKKEYYGTSLEDDNDCREDKWAKILLNGGSVEVLDYNADGEAYGNLPHTVLEEEGDDYDGTVRYTVTLNDIKEGVEKCLDMGGYESECARDLIEEDGNLDLPEAEAIMQVIIFGETIYG